ncbi:MAG: Hsp70 family protein, partial [Mesorhizobium sp.]
KQIRFEAERADLVGRFIHIVEHRYGHALAGLVERAKIALTDQPAAEVKVSLPGARFAAEITRAGLEATIGADIDRVTKTVRQTIADAGVDTSAITAVFLT